MNTPQKNVRIRDLSWRIFYEPADEDYLVARIAMRSGLMHQFYWSAQQAIEKYIKCSLVLNGHSVRRFSHDTVEPFLLLKEFSGDLIPSLFCPPRYFRPRSPFDRIGFETFENLIKKFNEFGDPSFRYRNYSITFRRSDLHRLDEVIFILRRLGFPLNMPYNGTELTYRQIFSDNRSMQPRNQFHPERNRKGIEAARIITAYKWQNFSFFEDAALDRGTYSAGLGFENSAINMLYTDAEEPLKQSALNWAVNNIRLSRTDTKEILEKISP